MSFKRLWERQTKAKCGCGKSFVERDEYFEITDWNCSRAGYENPRIICPKCREKYHIENLWKLSYENGQCDNHMESYLVPNGKTLKDKNISKEEKQKVKEASIKLTFKAGDTINEN